VALVQAKRLVQLGVVDACLVVGVMANLSPMEWQGFLQLGALGGHGFAEAPHQACRPFDALAEGFVYGQAAAAMLLESECSARSRGAEPLAELAGGAVVLHGTASADPSRDGETRAMKGALRDSGLQPKDAVYINTHGTSTPLGDRTELDALVETFGEHFPNLWLNSTKPITGHALTAAGVVEAVATVLQVRQSFLHPHLNLGTPIDARARWVGEKAISVPVPVAMSNSFGFSGINTSVVLRRWPS
jgi:malonyl-ACP decarboxylase